MTKSDLIKEIKAGAKRANQRLLRLERQGLTNVPAYEKAKLDIERQTSANKKTRFSASVKDKSYAELRAQLGKINKFNRAESSTKSGIEKGIKKNSKKYGFNVKNTLERIKQKATQAAKQPTQKPISKTDAYRQKYGEKLGDLYNVFNSQAFDDAVKVMGMASNQVAEMVEYRIYEKGDSPERIEGLLLNAMNLENDDYITENFEDLMLSDFTQEEVELFYNRGLGDVGRYAPEYVDFEPLEMDEEDLF